MFEPHHAKLFFMNLIHQLFDIWHIYLEKLIIYVIFFWHMVYFLNCLSASQEYFHKI